MTRIKRSANVSDVAEILRSIGDAAYEWRLDSDALLWSGNAAAVLGVADPADIASGRGFARRIEAEDGKS